MDYTEKLILDSMIVRVSRITTASIQRADPREFLARLILADEILPGMREGPGSKTDSSSGLVELLKSALMREPLVLICYEYDDTGRKGRTRTIRTYPFMTIIMCLNDLRGIQPALLNRFNLTTHVVSGTRGERNDPSRMIAAEMSGDKALQQSAIGSSSQPHCVATKHLSALIAIVCAMEISGAFTTCNMTIFLPTMDRMSWIIGSSK